jgi:hypothetical protein
MNPDSISEIHLILAEKRTLIAALRTGIDVFALFLAIDGRSFASAILVG